VVLSYLGIVKKEESGAPYNNERYRQQEKILARNFQCFSGYF